MQLIQHSKQFLVILGTLHLVLILLVSCQKVPEAKNISVNEAEKISSTPKIAVTATALVEPENIPTTMVHIITPTTDPSFNFSAALTQSVNGIIIQARNIRRGNGLIRADICFPLIDAGDWGIYDAYIRYEGHEDKYKRSILVEPLIPYKNGNPGRRCDTLEFRVPDQIKLSEFTISVRSLAATPRESFGCAQITKIQNKLNTTASGIRLSCKNAGGVESYEIISRPASMSQEDAQTLVYNELISLTEGPWEFTIRPK